MNIFSGMIGLLASKKGVLCLLILLASIVLCACHRLDGVYFAGVMATISSIFCWTAHKTDIASMVK